jgi:hypothetical protein
MGILRSAAVRRRHDDSCDLAAPAERRARGLRRLSAAIGKPAAVRPAV